MKGRNIKLIIAYDGTDFHGWQRQETQAETVQGVMENALEEMHKHPVSITGAGRTDAGVHAAGQTANFYTDIDSIPKEKFIPALNSILPKDVRVLEAQEVPQEFHARFSAVSRTYRYYFICNRKIMPHESRYNLHLWRFPNLETLNAYGRLLLGETDCTIFAGAGDTALTEGKSAYRYIYNARFFMENSRLVFEIRANAFLRNMVRSITGTFLHYEENCTDPKELQKIIASGRRKLAGPTLPPQGLFLQKVEYL